MDLPEVSHIGFIVKDINESKDRYSEIFHVDFNVYDFKPQYAWAYGKEIANLYFRIGMGMPDDGPGIEIIQPVECDDDHKLSFLETNGRMIHHLAYKVDNDNYETWKEYFLNVLNASIVFEAEIEDDAIGYRRTFYAQVKDTKGLLEIATHPQKR